MKALNLVKLALCSLTLMATASFGQSVGGGNSSVGTNGPATVTLRGPDADKLFAILARARLPYPRVLSVGSSNVSTDQAYCTRVVYPGAMATCVLTKVVDNVRTDRNVINQDADDLHDLIAKYIGLRPFQEVGVGASHAVALKLFCGRPVIPNPTTSCTLTRAGALQN